MKCFSIIRRSTPALLFFIAASISLYAEPTLDNLIAQKKYKEAVDYAEDKIPNSQRDAAVWVQLGRANEGLGVPEKALACYLVASRLGPDNYDALLGAATIYNTLGQPDEALTLAKKALDKNFTAEASWQYAKACIALNRSVEAKAALEKVIQGDSSNAIANKELGNIYFKEGAWDKALPLLKKSYQKSPEAGLAYNIGKCFAGIAMPDSSVVYLKEAIAKGGVPEDAGLELARGYYGKGDFANAAAEYIKLAGKGLTALDFYQTAVACEKCNNESGALEAYEKAVALFGEEKSKEALLAREKVARADMDKKAWAQALPHLEFIAAADQKAAVVPDIYFLLADAYQALNNAPRAIASLEKSLAINNKNVEAYARLADLYQKNGMADKAKQTLETIVSLSPNDPEIYRSLGQYNLKAKKYAEALTQFQKSNILKPSASAAGGVAIAAYNLNQPDVALDAAKSAVGQDPSMWEPRVILVGILMKDKNYKEAQPNLEYMVTKEPGKVEYKEQLATCYEQNGEKAKLLELDKQIVAKSPTNVDSRLRLALDADARNDVDAAYPLYKEIAILQPKNAEILHRLYEIALSKKNYNEASVYLGHCLDVKPTAEGERDYGDVLYMLKDYDRALTAYRAALKMNPAIKGFYKRYAEIVIAKGQQEEVITALSNVIKSGEADFGTYQTLGMIYQKKAAYPKAIEMYQHALQIDPQSNDALAAMAACQAAAGAPNDAIISYEQVAMMDTAATDIYRDLGDLYMEQNNSVAAIKNYKKYFARMPSDETVAKLLGKNAYESKDYPGVIKYLGALQYRTEDDAQYGLLYANACMETKQYKDAIRVLEMLRGLKFKGKVGHTLLNSLAAAYEADGQDVQASEAYGAYNAVPGTNDADAAYKQAFLLEKSTPVTAKKLYENNTIQYPKDYRNFLRLGIMLSAKPEMLTKAVGYLKKTAILAESVPAVWLELGKAYNEIGDTNASLGAYRKYIPADPQNPEANKQIGLILTEKGNTTEALTFLEVANMLTPNDPDVMAALAKGYAQTNRKSEAIELLKKAKAAKPQDAEIRYNLFDLYRQTGQDALASTEIQDLVKLAHDPKYLVGLVEASIKAGDLNTAENTIEDILAVTADDINVLMLKGKVQTLKKKYDDAINTYKEIENIDQKFAPVLVERANVYLLQSKVQWAEVFFQRALKLDPKNARAELGLAHLAKLRKDMAGYQEHLQKARDLDSTDKEIQDEARKALN